LAPFKLKIHDIVEIGEKKKKERVLFCLSKTRGNQKQIRISLLQEAFFFLEGRFDELVSTGVDGRDSFFSTL